LSHTLRGCTEQERELIAGIVSGDELSFDDFSQVSQLVDRYGALNTPWQSTAGC